MSIIGLLQNNYKNMEGIQNQESNEDIKAIIQSIQRKLDNIIGDLDEGRNNSGETTVNANVIAFIKSVKDDIEKVQEKLS